MKRFAVFIFFTAFCALTALAQSSADSLRIKARVDSIVSLQDTVRNKVASKNDSIQSKLNSASRTASDSLHSQIDKINSATDSLNAKIQSVERVGDKEINKAKSIESDINSKGDSKVLNDLGFETQDINVVPDNINLDASQYQIPKLDKVNSFDIEMPDIEINNVSSDKLSSGLSDLKSQADKFTSMSLEEISKIAQQRIEGIALTRKEFKELEIGQAQFDQLIAEKNRLSEMAPDVDELRSQAVNKGKSTANELIEKHSNKIKDAQTQMAKYKQKYERISSIKDLPKLPPNRMKGKPLVYRLQPGLSLQTFNSEFAELNVSPQLSFRWTGKLTIGAGVFQRVAFDKTDFSYQRIPLNIGLRGYAQFKFYKKLFLYGSVDRHSVELLDQKGAGVVWEQRNDFLLGIGQDYRISKKLRGFSIASINLSQLDSPFNIEKYQVRFGFYLNLHRVMKKKARK